MNAHKNSCRVRHYKEEDLKLSGFAVPHRINLLLISESYPKDDDMYFYRMGTNKRNRQFFHNVMIAVGLLAHNSKADEIDEKGLLGEFLHNGYFLIDTCPCKLSGKGKSRKQKTTQKINEMMRHVDSLKKTIKELKPKEIIFICKTTNGVISDYLKGNDNEIGKLIRKESPLPCPVRWKREINAFIDQFPEDLKIKFSKK